MPIPNLRTGVCSGYEIEQAASTTIMSFTGSKNTLNETLYLLEKNEQNLTASKNRSENCHILLASVTGSLLSLSQKMETETASKLDGAFFELLALLQEPISDVRVPSLLLSCLY